ncbi:MAG: S41 family peptidase [Desulfovibrio sp.]
MRIFFWLFTLLLMFSITVTPIVGSAAKDDEHFTALKRFSQVIDMVESYYVKDISRPELIDDAIKGMLEQLDPHSAYLPPKAFKEMQESTSGKFSGIGIEISMEKGQLTVITPIEDTPAYKAGLLAGDFILEIDGEATQGMSLMDAVDRIRGPRGKAVELLILHKKEQKPVVVEIVRDTIPIKTAKMQELDEGYLLVRLSRFSDNTTKLMREAIGQYSEDKPLKGIVLDLRNNPGGLLDQAVLVSDTFLNEGLIVYIKGKEESNRKDFSATPEALAPEVPIVVLINSGSASASEIVAGALQDQNRALVIGERSFGKGSVQTVIPMADGAAIKLTTALYYTPGGRSIQAKGIEPDLIVPFVAPSKEDEEKKDGMFLRESNLSGHLENGGSGKATDKFEPSDKVKKMLTRDNQLRFGLQMVKKLPRLKELR